MCNLYRARLNGPEERRTPLRRVSRRNVAADAHSSVIWSGYLTISSREKAYFQLSTFPEEIQRNTSMLPNRLILEKV